MSEYTTYSVEVRGEYREVYVVTASSEAEARRLFNAGELTEPIMHEALDADIVDVRRVTP